MMILQKGLIAEDLGCQSVADDLTATENDTRCFSPPDKFSGCAGRSVRGLAPPHGDSGDSDGGGLYPAPPGSWGQR